MHNEGWTSSEMTTNSMGAFESSGLPEYLQGSWNNASQILDLGGISGHPNDPSKYCVISLTQGNVHTVQVFESGCIKCDEQCYRFNSVSTCAHCLAVSKWLGSLENYVGSYVPNLDKMAASNLPKQVGKKPGERKRKRNRKLPKDKAGWKDRVPVTASPDDKQSGYTLVFVRDTSATTCYGCGGKVRTKPSENPPPPPFDIFL